MGEFRHTRPAAFTNIYGPPSLQENAHISMELSDLPSPTLREKAFARCISPPERLRRCGTSSTSMEWKAMWWDGEIASGWRPSTAPMISNLYQRATKPITEPQLHARWNNASCRKTEFYKTAYPSGGTHRNIFFLASRWQERSTRKDKRLGMLYQYDRRLFHRACSRYLFLKMKTGILWVFITTRSTTSVTDSWSIIRHKCRWFRMISSICIKMWWSAVYKYHDMMLERSAPTCRSWCYSDADLRPRIPSRPPSSDRTAEKTWLRHGTHSPLWDLHAQWYRR